MDKKLLRMFEPSVALCFVVIVVFAGITFLCDLLWLAALEAGIGAVLLIVYLVLARKRKRELQDYILSTTNSRDMAFSKGVPFPMAAIRIDSDEIAWANEEFRKVTNCQESVFSVKVRDALPGFSSRWLVDGKPEFPGELSLGGRKYRIFGSLFRAKGADSVHLMASLYLLDETELFRVRDEYIRSRPVLATVLIDNYEELTNNLPESNVSILTARLDAQVSAWVKDTHCLLRKIEKNRYLLVLESQHLDTLIEGKFSLLDNIHKVVSVNGLPASVSIGVGKSGADFGECYSFAQLALEMALSRGGDQAVIKDRYNFAFFGGRAQEASRHSRVRSRVLAGSLAELIRQSNQVFIMGHRHADTDAIGAAAGLMSLCRKCNVRARIVTDPDNNNAQALIARLRHLDAYEDVFLSAEEALVAADPRSLLIVVDTNRPEQVESSNLLEAMPRVALIDHHRKAADSIETVVWSLHEPSASSASELVAELLQYTMEVKEILPDEAKALLAGIVLDTKNFSLRTSSGTFEAAAFLRRMGADPTEVKKLFQSDLEHTVARYRIVQDARLYPHRIAISALDYTSNRATAAQAADELLNISGVDTSFVLYPDRDAVIISARSIGSTNVQVILEALGGGGNAATAGAQVQNTTVEQALEQLLHAIDEFYKK